MKYTILATDFDGTIAHHSGVPESTLDALRRVRASGRKLFLVTGRELDDLLAVFTPINVFDSVIAENGALLFQPSTRETRILSPQPPERFVEELLRRGVPISVGRSIVATVEPHEYTVLEVIRDLGLEWQVIFNKGAVMVLPSGINKATGLTFVLNELGVPAAEVVGVGDAENDHAFLRMCGLSVAVSNALQSVKDMADWVTTGARGAGVEELIAQLLDNDLINVMCRPECHI